MRKYLFLPSLALVVGAWISSASTPPIKAPKPAGTSAAALPAAAGPATMAALTQQFAEAMQQQDVAKATACFAKNARMLANVSPVLSGRDSLSTYWLKRSFSTSTNLKFTPLQTGGDATMGYATGYYTLDIKPTADNPKGASAHGSFMTLGHKEGTTWQLTYVHIAEEPYKANK
ncbi:YybH family protein [Hymenobacter caeli]|uniref:Ketosteroid isomerase-like protein n=1 Tax=Hymenobacter caeli TaxID=2735894 RepID=A0ABX2FJX5_9BACT|nr:nuclear transport factor 2 family protein [Hymenobacter caeli]NRT17414.1 ketosteroid isomerase-like protein [Hymenobacter caeli]